MDGVTTVSQFVLQSEQQGNNVSCPQLALPEGYEMSFLR